MTTTASPPAAILPESIDCVWTADGAPAPGMMALVTLMAQHENDFDLVAGPADELAHIMVTTAELDEAISSSQR